MKTILVVAALFFYAAGAYSAGDWQTLGQMGGIYRLDLDRSGKMPKGQGRVRIVVEQNGRLAGSAVTFEYDCARRTLHNLTSGDWADDQMINEKPVANKDARVSGRDASSEIILNGLCGVTIDTGRALDTREGWKPLGNFDGRQLQLLPRATNGGRGQFRLGNYSGGAFSGAGWVFEFDCMNHGMRNLREQVWKGGAMIRDEASMANAWTSTERSDLGRAIYVAMCPKG